MSRSVGEEFRLSFSIELLFVAREEVEPPVQRPLSSTGLCRLLDGYKERREASEIDLEGFREVEVGLEPLEESLKRRDVSLR